MPVVYLLKQASVDFEIGTPPTALATTKVEMQMEGLPGRGLPTIAVVEGIDASDIRLILAAAG